MFERIWAWMNRHAIFVIGTMVAFILVLGIITTGVFTEDREARYNQLIEAYEFLVDEEEGISTWTTEESWKAGMVKMIDLSPKDAFLKNALYGDNEALRDMMRNVRRVSFDNKKRDEVVELVMGLKVEDDSKWGLHRCKVDKKQIKEINYLTGIRMIY